MSYMLTTYANLLLLLKACVAFTIVYIIGSICALDFVEEINEHMKHIRIMSVFLFIMVLFLVFLPNEEIMKCILKV